MITTSCDRLEALTCAVSTSANLLNNVSNNEFIVKFRDWDSAMLVTVCVQGPCTLLQDWAFRQIGFLQVIPNMEKQFLTA